MTRGLSGPATGAKSLAVEAAQPVPVSEVRARLRNVKTNEDTGVDEHARTLRDARPLPPSRFGHYRIIGELGRGGMGVVYRARTERTDAECALKLLPPDLAKDEHYAERFKREVKACARLDHPVLLKVLDDGEQDGTLYFGGTQGFNTLRPDSIVRNTHVPPNIFTISCSKIAGSVNSVRCTIPSGRTSAS